MKKVLLSLMVACMMMGSINVSAAGQPFELEFSSKDEKKVTDPYAKEDNEQNAYVTLIEDPEKEDFIVGKDVFGCRVRKNSNDAAVTDYTLVKKFITYKLPCTSKTYKGTKYYLKGQIDSTGVYSFLRVKGRWLP